MRAFGSGGKALEEPAAPHPGSIRNSVAASKGSAGLSRAAQRFMRLAMIQQEAEFRFD